MDAQWQRVGNWPEGEEQMIVCTAEGDIAVPLSQPHVLSDVWALAPIEDAQRLSKIVLEQTRLRPTSPGASWGR